MKKYALGYFDILGTKKRIENDIDVTIENLWDVAQSLKTDNFYKIEENKEIPEPQNVIIRSFTDNFLLAKEVEDIPFQAVNPIFVALGKVITECLLKRRILVRGAAVIGDMHIDDVAIVGPALLKAYDLESNVCVYPRIIADSSIVDAIPGAITPFRQFGNYFFEDYDGAICFNYLICVDPDYLRGNIPATIEQLIADSSKLPMKGKVKYEWLIRYLRDYYEALGKRN